MNTLLAHTSHHISRAEFFPRGGGPMIDKFPNSKFFSNQVRRGAIQFPIFPKYKKKSQFILGKKIMNIFHFWGHFLFNGSP